MSRAAEFPWVVVPAYAIYMGARWINRRIDQPPRERPVPPDQHVTPTQVRTPIRGTLLRPGRELDRGDRW